MTERNFLFNLQILPDKFKFPESYLSMVKENKFPDLEPWSFLCRDQEASLSYYSALLAYYKDKPLVPFAIVNDQTGLFNDGYVVLACFDASDLNGDPGVYFHDYGNTKTIEWENRYKLASFEDWLKLAAEDSATYKAMKEND